MKRFFIFILFFYCTNLLAQEIKCFILEPPEQILNGVKKIAVLDFNGTYGRLISDYLISALIENQRGIRNIKGGLFSKDVEGKTYLDGAKTDIYTLVERSRLDQVLSEQNLSISGIVDENQAAHLGKVLGVDAIIIGTVNPIYNDSNTREEIEVLRNKKWVKVVEDCITRNVSVDSRMRIINVNTGQIIGIKESTHKITEKKCGNDIPQLISADELIKQSIQACVYQDFVNYFSPRFSLREFELFEIDLDEYEVLSEKAIEYAENGKFDKAYVIYSSILSKDPYNDIAHYNIGILNEIVGNYQAALDSYQSALNIRDDDDYSDAIRNIKKALEFNKALAALDVIIKQHNYSATEDQLKSATSEKIKLKGGKSDRIILRLNPNLDGDIVVKVPGGIELELLDKTGAWYKVKTFDGKIGYVNEDDLN